MNGSKEYFAAERLFHGHIPLIMGTRFDLIAVGTEERPMTEVWKRLCSKAEELDRMLNRFAEDSEIGRLNKAANLRNQSLSEELRLIIDICMDYREKTLGLFDVASGRMAEILVDEECGLSLFGNRLDFGGFAKGYFLKFCGDILSESGVRDAFVDFGDSTILAKGHHPCGDCWKVGIVNPFTHTVLSETELRDRTLSSSGNTPGYSGHIINPSTGECVRERRMVTVTSPNPLDAEVLSTVLMIAAEEERSRILSGFPDVEYEIFNL